jgi:hypothetical protein
MSNPLVDDLAGTMTDPRHMSDAEIDRRAREILDRYEKEGTPPGSEAAAARAREIMAKRDRWGKDPAGRPLDFEFELARVIALLPDVKYPISDHAPTRDHAAN